MTGSLAALGAGIAVIGAGLGIGNIGAKAMEAIAHGKEEESKVVGRKIEDINLPKGAAIVALVRDGQVIIAHHDTVIETDDHVILFLTDRRKIENLENLFQVGVSFV